MKRYITLLSVLLATVAGMAQATNDTINRMVLVESTYNPIIAGAVKRNFLPEEVKPSMNKEKVVYANENVDLTHFDRKAQPAQLVEVMSEKGTPGYAHLGYGNYNNLSALAAYKLHGKRSDLALRANVDGWNGNIRLDDNTKWRSNLYDMGLGADYDMQLGNVALNAGAHAAYYTYNYLADPIVAGGTDVQQANSLGAHLGIKGVAKEHYYYHGAVGYTRFGRSTHFSNKAPHSENHLHVETSFGIDFYEWGMASVMLHSDVLTYQGIGDYNGCYDFGITSRWDYEYGDFQFVAGVNMDFLFGKHIAQPLQLSPECSISYVPGKLFSAKLTLDGGRDIHTFGQLYALSPYWAAKEQLRPSYTFLNARLEGSLRIIEGLHLNIGGGYKMLGDALFETVMDSLGTTYTGMTNHNAQVATADAGVSYVHKDIVSFSAKGAYYHWMMKGDRALLARAPQLKVDVDARVRIIPNLYGHTNLQIVSFTNTKVAARERAIIDWSLGANYALNKRFSFFLDAHNLLNHRHQYYTGYPAQGIHVLAGAMVKF